MIFTILFALRIILSLFIVILSIGIILTWKKSLPFKPKLTPRQTLQRLKIVEISEGKYKIVNKQRELAQEQWKKLEEKIRLPDEKNIRLAIIEADNIVDGLLQAYGLAGEDMGGRLKSINRESLESLRELWSAHRFRNQLVHDTDFHPPLDEMKNNLDWFYKALEELLNKKLETK